MKKHLILIGLLIFLLLPNFALASTLTCPEGEKPCKDECIAGDALCLQLSYPKIPYLDQTLNQIAAGGAENILGGLAQYIYYFIVVTAGLAAFAMLVWGGFVWLTSQSPIRIGDAKSIITAALLGLVIVFSSYLILSTINPDLVLIQPFGISLPTGCKWVGDDLQCPFPVVKIGGQTCPENALACLYMEKGWSSPVLTFLQKADHPSALGFDALSIKVGSDSAVRFWENSGHNKDKPFEGYNICFKEPGYPDLTKCPIPKGDNWIDDVYSLQIISANKCQNPGSTLNEDKNPTGLACESSSGTPEAPFWCEKVGDFEAEYKCQKEAPPECTINPVGNENNSYGVLCTAECRKRGGEVVLFNEYGPGKGEWYCCNAKEDGQCKIEGKSREIKAVPNPVNLVP